IQVQARLGACGNHGFCFWSNGCSRNAFRGCWGTLGTLGSNRCDCCTIFSRNLGGQALGILRSLQADLLAWTQWFLHWQSRLVAGLGTLLSSCLRGPGDTLAGFHVGWLWHAGWFPGDWLLDSAMAVGHAKCFGTQFFGSDCRSTAGRTRTSVEDLIIFTLARDDLVGGVVKGRSLQCLLAGSFKMLKQLAVTVAYSQATQGGEGSNGNECK